LYAAVASGHKRWPRGGDLDHSGLAWPTRGPPRPGRRYAGPGPVSAAARARHPRARRRAVRRRRCGPRPGLCRR